MQLIEAIVMVAQEYDKTQGWIIRRPGGEHIQKIQVAAGPRYASYGPGLLRASAQLEVVVAALAECDPTVARDDNWQIMPFPAEVLP